MWRLMRAAAIFQLSCPSDRIGTSRNATTVPITVATALQATKLLDEADGTDRQSARRAYEIRARRLGGGRRWSGGLLRSALKSSSGMASGRR
uniref:Uncharacterized protein n=1 Tax=Arundo donax TaxID=35708 RepID=A0A0A9DYC3_ARUDO